MRLIIGNVQTPASPLLRAVSLIAGAVVLVTALFFGAVLFVVVLGIVLVLGAVAAARVWWISRKLRSSMQAADPHVTMQTRHSSDSRYTASGGGRVIEGEYVEVKQSSGRSRTSSHDRHDLDGER